MNYRWRFYARLDDCDKQIGPNGPCITDADEARFIGTPEEANEEAERRCALMDEDVVGHIYRLIMSREGKA